MKLDRNIVGNQWRGKYALILLRQVELPFTTDCDLDATMRVASVPEKAIDYGDTPENEFFVIRLRDKFAADALSAYACAALTAGETEFAEEVQKLADKARNHPSKKQPD